MGLVKCDECGSDLSPKNFHEVERVKTGEEIAICNKCYNKFFENGWLEVVDEDGNRTHCNKHMFRGTNTEIKPWPYPCPCCGSVTYLGVFIPTVAAFYADYYGWSYQCYNQSCTPLYDEYKNEDGAIVYDLVAYGAYWGYEDDCYYTPQNPRL